MSVCHAETLEGNWQPPDNTLQKWISYIGRKYIHLEKLEFWVYGGVIISNKELIADSLASILNNLKQLKNYSVNLIPPSQTVLDALNANNVQLNHLLVYLDSLSLIEGTLKGSSILLINIISSF